ncbi:MAG: sigma-70 family RNA polymerase sigma factor [Anaerolineae bacterium]|nr:sigma-70 family RNA polymerase sigma factor [Anaerolineae bacterium]
MYGTTAVLPNELALVSRARVEPAAFAAVYDHYFPRVYNYVRYRVNDPATADDLTAQVFERVLARIRGYNPERAPFAAWLFAIARNAVSDHLRAHKRRRWLALDVLSGRFSAEPKPEEILVRKEGHAELLAAVARLSDRQRNLIGLKFGAGLTNRRIAELTGLSESNVGVILYRTMRRLRAEMSAEECDHERERLGQ